MKPLVLRRFCSAVNLAIETVTTVDSWLKTVDDRFSTDTNVLTAHNVDSATKYGDEKKINSIDNKKCTTRFTCNICSAEFGTYNGCRKHRMRVHLRVFLCEECKKSFGAAEDLKRHQVTHKGERPFFCHLCKKAFNQMANLKTHVVVMHLCRGEFVVDPVKSTTSEFHCLLCHAMFQSNADFKLHCSEHLKELCCELCGKHYVTKNARNTHQCVPMKLTPKHKDEETEVLCRKCGDIFQSTAALKIHKSACEFKELNMKMLKRFLY